MREIYPAYPPDTTQEELEYLLTNIKDWSIAHGLAVRPAPSFVPESQDPHGSLAVTAPVTLFPSLFPRSCFDQAVSVQTAYNELYMAVASDEAWLKDIVEDLVDIDDFIGQLWRIHEAVKAEGYVQDLSLGLFRSDYMVHLDPESVDTRLSARQVEFNTIASSFGGLSLQVSNMHKHLLQTDSYPPQSRSIIQDSSLPSNKSVPCLAQGLAKAHVAYGSSRSSNPACVIFIVQQPERNVFDQRHLEYTLLADHKVKSFRLPFHRVLSDTKLGDKRELLYTPPHQPLSTYEVSVVYFRAGYSPTDYNGEQEWKGRLQLERSMAIKCPSVLTHLAGSKKVQQVLATPLSPHLTRFLGQKLATEVQHTFVPIYPLDTSEAGQQAKKLAFDEHSAARYVLKPQREGGGNNVYRKAIPEFLKSIPEDHWPAYILMEMIEPPALSNSLLRNGDVQKGGVIGELGVYGVCLWQNVFQDGTHSGVAKTLENYEAGFLLRTKGDQSEEGGVAAGFGAVDSPCLVDV